MSKQDRQGVRTAADLERRYKYSESLKEAKRAAAASQQAAHDARQAVSSLDLTLDQVEIINRLTRNGAAKGIYNDAEGEIYINANYVTVGGPITLYGYVDSKIAYVAMVTGALLDGQVTKEKVAAWYGVALWSAAMVNEAVNKGILTTTEAEEILGKAVTV